MNYTVHGISAAVFHLFLADAFLVTHLLARMLVHQTLSVHGPENAVAAGAGSDIRSGEACYDLSHFLQDTIHRTLFTGNWEGKGLS